ncbi:uncharacterized protein LOC114292187 [Camellia sinensis]|uniref:uncharacterized protein LOC114286905 n=1 Tax=Camellia sinensis TaxID=4442 RepID=UPI0010356FCF|nr:uncharacterized protein LOC114286905 [Camellia sinensis]XP_028091896.1 uncharacterized protein LOC114292187 [Camellia sinensis]
MQPQLMGHSKGPKNDRTILAGEESASEEVEDSDDELSPSEDEGEVFQFGAMARSNKIKTQLNESKRSSLQRGCSGKEKMNNLGVQGKLWSRKGRIGAPFKNGFQRGALVRAAALASLSSLSISNNLRKQRKIRKEAEDTVQLGMTLGLAMNGKEAEVVERVIQMEVEDMDRVKAKGVEPGA